MALVVALFGLVGLAAPALAVPALAANPTANRTVNLTENPTADRTANLAAAQTEDETEDPTWGGIASEMEVILEDAWTLYQNGELDAAHARVDDAYYGYYEAKGFEKIVMSFVSGQAATDAEYEFGLIKKAIKAGGPSEEVRSHIDALEGMLTDQAASLDGTGGEGEDGTGKGQSAWVLFVQSLLVILREGFEAILVLGAIIAYLVKSGNRDKLGTVYTGAALAVLASGLLAVAINQLQVLSGANQELTEGVTALLAVAMLVWVSNWVLSKSESSAWSSYIKSKMDSSLGRGSVFSLAFVAFLAVFREGAEIILMFQPLANQAGDNAAMIWYGLGIGLVLLVGVYLAIRYLSIRLPLRPFFLATSGLLALLALSFAGAGVKELQEAGVVGITPLNGVPTIDLLGVYPSAEPLVAQAFVLVVMIVLGLWAVRKGRRAAAGQQGQDDAVLDAEAQTGAHAGTGLARRGETQGRTPAGVTVPAPNGDTASATASAKNGDPASTTASATASANNGDPASAPNDDAAAPNDDAAAGPDQSSAAEPALTAVQSASNATE
jgi:high-affinity iron transporter